MTALLPRVVNPPEPFNSQHVSNLMWALAKLVEREVLTPEKASEGVMVLLSQVQKLWSEFKPQGIANLVWALAKLVERKVLTPEQASKAVAALLPAGGEPFGTLYLSTRRQPAVGTGETGGA